MSKKTVSDKNDGLPRGGFLWGEPPRYGQVRLVSPSSTLIAVSTTDRGREVDAMICPAVFDFIVPRKGVTGRFVTKSVRGRVAIKTITFTPDESDASTVFIEGLGEEFLNAVLSASNQIATVRAKRSRNGTLQRVQRPTGGRGKGRLSQTPWNDPSEIAKVVGLMQAVEAGYKNGTHRHLDTKLKREAWVAKKTRTWSAGTVHLQLQVARNQGLLKKKGKKK